MTGTRDARRRVLRAAETMFYERGIAATGVDALAERAGVGKMSLYRHFASKDDLVAEALRARDPRHLAWLLPDDPGGDDGPDGARRRMLAVFDRLADAIDGGGSFRGCPFVKAAAELPPAAHPAWAAVRQHKAAVTGRLAALAAAAGAADPRGLADELLLLIDGAAVHGVLRQDAEPARAARRLAALAIDAATGAARPERRTR